MTIDDVMPNNNMYIRPCDHRVVVVYKIPKYPNRNYDINSTIDHYVCFCGTVQEDHSKFSIDDNFRVMVKDINGHFKIVPLARRKIRGE